MKRTFPMWQPHEEQQLAIYFDEGKRIEQIAALLCRSPLAIQARLVRIGKMTPEQAGFTKVTA